MEKLHYTACKIILNFKKSKSQWPVVGRRFIGPFLLYIQAPTYTFSIKASKQLLQFQIANCNSVCILTVIAIHSGTNININNYNFVCLYVIIWTVKAGTCNSCPTSRFYNGIIIITIITIILIIIMLWGSSVTLAMF